MKEVLNKIRNIRESKDLTQDFIAIQLNMTASNYAKIERGELPMTLDHIEIIAKTLRIKAGDFFNVYSEIANEDAVGYQIQPIKDELQEIKLEIRQLKAMLERSTGKNEEHPGAEL